MANTYLYNIGLSLTIYDNEEIWRNERRRINSWNNRKLNDSESESLEISTHSIMSLPRRGYRSVGEITTMIWCCEKESLVGNQPSWKCSQYQYIWNKYEMKMSRNVRNEENEEKSMKKMAKCHRKKAKKKESSRRNNIAKRSAKTKIQYLNDEILTWIGMAALWLCPHNGGYHEENVSSEEKWRKSAMKAKRMANSWGREISK